MTFRSEFYEAPFSQSLLSPKNLGRFEMNPVGFFSDDDARTYTHMCVHMECAQRPFHRSSFFHGPVCVPAYIRAWFVSLLKRQTELLLVLLIAKVAVQRCVRVCSSVYFELIMDALHCVVAVAAVELQFIQIGFHLEWGSRR